MAAKMCMQAKHDKNECEKSCDKKESGKVFALRKKYDIEQRTQNSEDDGREMEWVRGVEWALLF
jgi:hypothetical protein